MSRKARRLRRRDPTHSRLTKAPGRPPRVLTGETVRNAASRILRLPGRSSGPPGSTKPARTESTPPQPLPSRKHVRCRIPKSPASHKSEGRTARDGPTLPEMASGCSTARLARGTRTTGNLETGTGNQPQLLRGSMDQTVKCFRGTRTAPNRSARVRRRSRWPFFFLCGGASARAQSGAGAEHSGRERAGGVRRGRRDPVATPSTRTRARPRAVDCLHAADAAPTFPQHVFDTVAPSQCYARPSPPALIRRETCRRNGGRARAATATRRLAPANTPIQETVD